MDSLDSISLTKYYFAHKPVKHARKKSNIRVSPESHKTEFPLWDELASKIKLIEKKSYAETFEGILKFVNNCLTFPLEISKEIPAAVLVMGVNMSDHSHIFHFLETYLQLNDIYTTVILDSKRSHSFTSIVQTIYIELLNKYEQFFNIEDCLPKKQDCSFDKLYEYYQNILERVNSKRRTPKKKQKIVDITSMPIILLIQDVENFNTEILQKLVIVCKLYSDKLPIVLIFGMASAIVTLHSILPQEAYSCLEVETFHSASATEYLTQIIDEVIISPDQPFKLGTRVFKLIIDTVLYHDFSISNLTYLLKFSLVEHLDGKSLAPLCCHESEIHKRVNGLSNEDLQTIRSLPSLKIFVDNNPNFLTSMNKPSTLKEFIITQVQQLFDSQKVIIVLLKLLHCFVKDLPKYPLGKQLRELYSLALEKEICLSSAYSEAEKLLKMQSQAGLTEKLKAGLSVLKASYCDFESSLIEEAIQVLETYLEKMTNLTTNEFDKNDQDPLSLQTEKITSRFQFLEIIQQNIKQKRSNYEALRNEIVESLHSIFKFIRPPSSFPLSEIFYFDNVSAVKQHIMAVPRVTSCHRLSNPRQIFKCNCCKITVPEETQISMPDISILYKLHLESGKLINLCDWLVAFKAIKCSEENVPRKRKTKIKDNDADLNIRFLQAVTELQFLGFIKSTKRKTDHVARLTFGTF